jgi:hypothetical protein
MKADPTAERSAFISEAAALLKVPRVPDDPKQVRMFLADSVELHDYSMIEANDVIFIAFNGEGWKAPEAAQKLKTAAAQEEDALLCQCAVNAREILDTFMHMEPISRQPVCRWTLLGPIMTLCHPLSRHYLSLGGPLGVKCLLVAASMDLDLSGSISDEGRVTFDGEVKQLVTGLTKVMRTMLIVISFVARTANGDLASDGARKVSPKTLDWFGTDDQDLLALMWVDESLDAVVAGVMFGLQVAMLVMVAVLDGGLLHSATTGNFLFLFRLRNWLCWLVWLPIMCFCLLAVLTGLSAFLFEGPTHGIITLGGVVCIFILFTMSASYVVLHETLISQHREAVKKREAMEAAREAAETTTALLPRSTSPVRPTTLAHM